ncbi:GGDEF domain-containing protein [Lentzea indica]|uniref:GGDEF domain-containing protein n=1 Tax=Lentzea indica TaxID=2604800 RepID=UPI0035E3FF46
MTALRPEIAETQQADASVDKQGPGLVGLHESIATLLASRGQWRQAYQHLRSALDLVYADRVEEPHVPEQLRREVDRLRREHAEAREQSLRDSLTDSYNRRYLDQRLMGLLTEHGACRHGLAIALIDLDWFKQVNDSFGHLLGDRVLQRVVELLQQGLPEGAFCARYGGEEFVLVLPRVDAATAVEIAEAARERVERHPWQEVAPGLRVTVSAGLAYERPRTRHRNARRSALSSSCCEPTVSCTRPSSRAATRWRTVRTGGSTSPAQRPAGVLSPRHVFSVTTE